MSRRGSLLSPPRPPETSTPPHIGTWHRRLPGLAIAAVVVTFLLVGVGALVRATGSGEGCSGWPKCSAGRLLPPLQYHAIIEYAHRMTAFVDVLLVAIVAIVAWRGYRGVPRVLRPALGGVGLIVVQAVLGGIVVKGDLAALLVSAHFGAAMILVADLVYLAVAAHSADRVPATVPDPVTRLARAAALSCFALLVVGAYVRGEDAGLAFPDWPLMNGRLVPSLSSTPAALHFTHRLLALIVGVAVAAMAVQAWRSRRTRAPVAVLGLTAAGLFVGQVFAGAANVWTHLSQPAVVTHVALAALVWGALVATAATARVVPGDGALDRHEETMA